MWIGVQIFITLFLISIAIILPSTVYCAILLMGIIATFIMVFTNWLLTIQIANILISGGIGMIIIIVRDKCIEKAADMIRNPGRYFRIEPNLVVVMILSYFIAIYWSYGEVVFYTVPLSTWFYGGIAGAVFHIVLFWSILQLLKSTLDYTGETVKLLMTPISLQGKVLIAQVVYAYFVYGSVNYHYREFIHIAMIFVVIALLKAVENGRIRTKQRAMTLGILIVAAFLAIEMNYYIQSFNVSQLFYLSGCIRFLCYCILYLRFLYQYRFYN